MAGPGWSTPDYERITERFVEWARAEDAIRAAVVIGSRAREDHPADEWADLDILAITGEGSNRFRESGWVSRIGDAWITFTEAPAAGHGLERRVLFAGGVDVDFAFITVEEIETMLASDPRAVATAIGRGFRVLVDKDGLVGRLFGADAFAEAQAASLPDLAAFEQVTSDFWYHAVWTAKHLRRGELWWAKLTCDAHMKELLRRALEWDAVAAGRDPWFRGRFLEEWADPAAVRGLRAAFARYDEDDVWAALAATMELFGEVTQRTAAASGLDGTRALAAEEHARALVAQLRTTRPAAPG